MLTINIAMFSLMIGAELDRLRCRLRCRADRHQRKMGHRGDADGGDMAGAHGRSSRERGSFLLRRRHLGDGRGRHFCRRQIRLALGRRSRGVRRHRDLCAVPVPETPYWVSTRDRKVRIEQALTSGEPVNDMGRAWNTKADKVSVGQLFLPDIRRNTIGAMFVGNDVQPA